MILGIGSLPMFVRSLCGFSAILGICWLVVCGICNLIFWCFGWEFTAKIGTGIFLVIVFGLALFKGNK
jgi:hypothetical protein